LGFIFAAAVIVVPTKLLLQVAFSVSQAHDEARRIAANRQTAGASAQAMKTPGSVQASARDRDLLNKPQTPMLTQ
jgi:hypothetical protein